MNATQRLSELEASAEEAQTRYSAALDVFRRSEHTGAVVDVLTPLHDYHRDIETRRREANPAELRHLTDEACARIVADGLIFFVPSPGQLTLVDPSHEDEVTAARDALTAVRNERNRYERESRDEREAERKKAEADVIKDALDSGDADRIREALNPSGDGPLTTADLSGPVRRKSGITWHT